MTTLTYYVAMPFTLTEDGDLVAGQPKEMRTADAAIREAQRIAQGTAGAVAFSRTGNPSTGEFEDALVLAKFGEVGEVE